MTERATNEGEINIFIIILLSFSQFLCYFETILIKNFTANIFPGAVCVVRKFMKSRNLHERTKLLSRLHDNLGSRH